MEFTIRLARSKTPPKPDLGEIGRTGTKTYGGRFFDDYKTDLAGVQAVETYEKMRRSDTQVAMTLRALKLPILQAKWDVVPSEDDPKDGEQIAEFVKRMLFSPWDRQGRGWRYTLRHALLMLDFGWALFEKVWEIRETPAMLRGLGAPPKVTWLSKLAPRMHPTIDQWLGLDKPPYELTGVRQRVVYGGSGTFVIPVEKLLIFTNEMEGDNYQGRSLLRSAYKDWYYAETLEKIDAIGLERAAVGTPEVRISDASQVGDIAAVKAMYEDILANLQTMERSFIITVPGTEFLPNIPTYNNDAIRASIRDHKRAISVNAIMQFMELGAENAAGSRATAGEQRGPFDLSILALADEISEGFQGLTEDIVRYNFGERPGYPSVRAAGITESDLSSLATIIKELVDCGAMTADDEMEDWLRDTLNLPAKLRPAKAEPEPSEEPPAEIPEETPEETELSRAGEAHAYFWRQPTHAERFVAFAQIKYDLDQAKEGFIARVGAVAEDIALSMIEDALPQIEARDIDRLLALKPAKVPKLASRIKGELKPLVAYGRQTVREERERALRGESAAADIIERREGNKAYQDDWLTDEGIAEWQTVKAQRRAEAIADAIDAAVTDEGLRLIRAKADPVKAKATLKESTLKSVLRAVVEGAGRLIAEGFGMGRGSEIQVQVEQGLVTKGIYSALLDDNACDVCRPLDGQVFTPDDPDFEKYLDGNADDCLGGERCRCMLFLEYADMEQPEIIDWKPGDEPEVVMPGFNPRG